MQLALLVIGLLIIFGSLLALPVMRHHLRRQNSSNEPDEGSLQAGVVFWAVAVMFGLGVIFLALVI